MSLVYSCCEINHKFQEKEQVKPMEEFLLTMKDKEVITLPTVSFTKERLMENDIEMIGGRARGHSFEDMMKNNIPSVARNHSPKPHRKHHHHHHHRHSPRSPNVKRKDNLHQRSSVPESNLLRVEKEHGDDLNRMRSYSDTQLAVLSDNHLVASSPLLERPLYTRQSSVDESDTSTDNDDGELNKEVIPIFKGHEEDATMSREFIGDGDELKSSDKETISRRKEEIVTEVKKSSKKLRKIRTLQMIDELIQQCTENYNDFESNVEIEFTRLHAALETRKKELLEDGKSIRDARIESLKESKKNCSRSESFLSPKNSSTSCIFNTDSGSGSKSSSRRDSGERDDYLPSNGIFEPWKDSEKESSGSVDLEKVVKKLNGDEICSEILQEGNITFQFNEELLEMFSNFGQIDHNLSSPQFSFVKGLQHGIALAGESVNFEIHTRDINNELSFNEKDTIKCQIFDLHGEAIDITKKVSLQRCLSNGRVASLNSPRTPLHKFYTYVFTPRELGKFSIRIFVNNVEIKSSPFLFSVYPKVDLTFNVNSPEERKEMTVLNGACSVEKRRQITMKRRQSSEEGDWIEENWIVQKGDKSSLLRCITDVPSYIYAAPPIKGFCAWKLRVTSACESVNLSVGVGTRSGIPDIDEHFSCDFALTPSKNQRNISNSKYQVRKTSSFTRISVTYTVLVSTEDGIVRVICEQKDDDKTVKINADIMEKFDIFPFVSMVHRHDECGKQICPKPQITLL